jgi:hypothetical protein
VKNLIIVALISLVAPQITQGQGTTYVSNLGAPSTGTLPVGTDSWLAADFITGTNAGGYLLNYVQLAIADASGNPSGFTAMLSRQSSNPTATLPGPSLGSLSGSLSPVTADTYLYTPALNMTLLPSTPYFIVLTAATPLANGAYEWNITSTISGGYNNYHWGNQNGVWFDSSDGSHWGAHGGIQPQFALNATPVPEPAVLGLLVLGGSSFLWPRRNGKVV